MIEAFISLSDIKNPESLYKIRMSICNDTTVNKFQKIGESEIQTGPKILFDVSFIFEYFFEKEQILSVEVIENDRLKIAEFRTSVGRIMGSRGACYKTQITNIQNEELCEMTIDCKNATKSVIDIKFQISCNFKNLLSSANFLEVYFIINNKNDGKNWRRVYKSAEQSGEKNSDINFSPVKLMMDDINAADMDKDFLIEFFDSVEGFIGCVQVSVNQLKKNGILEIHSQIPNTSEYINNKIIGEAKINIQEGKVYKFIDYLKEGMQVNLIVGIDFTCSNGNFEEPNSLHYCRGSSPNYYERAIKTCGSIVAYYDYDQKFPVYGFGGRTPGEFRANHCFNLNFNLNDPNVLGIDGVIDTYRNHLPLIKLDGPTYFAPLIRRVFENVKNDMSISPKVYYILLILTDGQINDMDATCDALVSCDVFPISVIIIGIGNADFTNMNILGNLKF